MDDATLAAAVSRAMTRTGTRADRAQIAARLIHVATGERWVGIYDVGPSEIKVLAWHGPSGPAHPQFARDAGLSGAALRTRRPVIAGDVATDPRYLPTLGDTRSEVIIPI